jgi:hypothetical protein
MTTGFKVNTVEQAARAWGCSYYEAARRLGARGGRKAQAKRRAERARVEAQSKTYWWQNL